MRHFPLCQSALCAAWVVVAACGKEGKPSTGAAGSANTQPSGKNVTVALFGNKPVPPGDLAKIKPKMKQAEFKAMFPAAGPTPNRRGSPSFTIDSGFSDAQFNVMFYSDLDQVSRVEVVIPTSLNLLDPIKAAWGKPTDERGGTPRWTNDADGYEAEVRAMGSKTSVMYVPFTPLSAAFFGSAPGPIADLSKVQFGMTRDEVAKAVPGLEGPPPEGGSSKSYEAGPKDVTLHVSYDGDGKVNRMTVRMPTRAMALLSQAWGAPRDGKSRGGGDAMKCWRTDKLAADIVVTSSDIMSLDLAAPDKSWCEFAP